MDNRLWSLVSQYHAVHRGKEYRRQCSVRETPRTPGNNVTLPSEFSFYKASEVLTEPQPKVDSGTDYVMNEKDLSAVRSIAVFEKFMLMSKSLVKAIVDDLDGAHVFQVSADEKEVIYHDSASLVLGRSGTGKTTCIVFKMLGIERVFEEAEEAKPRQVFITQSPVLAQKVREYYHSLIRTYSDRSGIPNQTTVDDELILADLRDDGVESCGLPSRYSLLEDRHFPLFLSFDQFCSLLEEDYISKFGHLARLQTTTRHFNPNFRVEPDEEFMSDKAYFDDQLLPAVWTMGKIKEHRHARINFDVFAFAYWPHFDQRLTYRLDPALVYNEFIGVIEGSGSTLTSQSGVLSRDDYLLLSQGDSLLSSQRDRVYTLYESYRKARGRLNGYDAAERTHALLVATRDGTHILGSKIDALYVDEVQDNLMIDSKLLFNLSNNPHGILMAGDTAQTISAGSSFRFEDLREFFWGLERQNSAVCAEKRKPIHPVLFHLSVNYRSHGGIVDCASTIVELVSELFPYSIDKLKRETGLGGNMVVSKLTDFFEIKGENAKIDFGADQVILVRNNAAREALRAQVGEIGLILTLYESKGLEFNDVLLYNFFEDSVASATTWRIVLTGLESSKHRLLPQFDAVRHAVVCTELKNLYVGLTRARNHCWIWDVSERAGPMKTDSQAAVQEFWAEKELIQQCGPGDPVPRLGASSSKSEWEERGRTLFERQLYSQAMLCFKRAGLTLQHDIAAAYEARKQARLLQATKSNERESRSAFRDAAGKFLECCKFATSKQQNSCYLRAAECFVQAEEWKLAAETFILARDFGMAAKNFRHAGCFAQAVDIVKTHQDKIQESVAEEIIKIARLEYLRTEQYKQAEELFKNVDEQLDYMEDCGLESGRIHVLEQNQRHEEAAEVAAAAAFSEGNIIEGVRLLHSSNDPKLLHRALEKALQGLWILFPFNHQIGAVDNPAADTLIQHLSNEPEALNEEQAQQLEVFRVIREGDIARIGELAQLHGKPASELSPRSALSFLCFPRSSGGLVPSDAWSLQDFINSAKVAWKYFSPLFLFARTLDMSEISTQMLLGVERAEHRPLSTEASEGGFVSPGFRVYSTSLLYNYLLRLDASRRGVSTFNHTLNVTSSTATESDTRELALNALYSILRAEIYKVHEAAASPDFQVLYPCLEFAVFGNCKRSDCRKQHTNSLRASETECQVSFNLRARALIMQIHIADKYYAQTHQDETERRKIRRTWARKMYETLMPLFPPLGGPHYVDATIIPELDKGAYLISVWCQQALSELDPHYGAKDKFLSDALAFLDLAFRVDGKGFAKYVDSLHSSRLVKPRWDLMTSYRGVPSGWPSYSIVHDFINFYRRKSDDAIWRVIRAVQLIRSSSWADLEDAILRCPLNCGPDRLVRLFRRKNTRYPQPLSNKFIEVIVYNRIPDLNQQLSFTDSAPRPQPTPNSQAEPPSSSHPSQSSSANKTGPLEPAKDMESEEGDTTGLMQSNHEAARFDALPEGHSRPMNSLTSGEIESGLKILFAYRRYVLRKQARPRLAVRKIWRCYSRYLHRRDAPRTAADIRYLEFQHEYKKDIKMPERSQRASESFYEHKAILLGYMPHAAVCLRGLVHVNNQQNQANRKRLQSERTHHKELEEIQAIMDACRKFTKELKKLVSAIMPGSSLLHDLRALRVNVKKLDNVYREMEGVFGREVMPESLEQHHYWGIAIILARPA
ncbi:hypothetical protein FRC11_008770 [Ceratobasidium sp. 423]|nr:hypothetical protein FRC11_008770 [Ceratobasidium sp. 423]